MKAVGRWGRLALLGALLVTAAAARLVPDDGAAVDGRTPLILIHGWNADASTWNAFALSAPTAALKLYRFSYDWQRSIQDSADLLRQDLAAATELSGRPVVLVGHSMGGLVARAYVESRWPGWDGLARVGLAVFLGSPHHGTPLANLEWLAADSKYSAFAKLLPLATFNLLDGIPITRAQRSQGGRELGWDNADGQMPAGVWAAADRFLYRLNENLAHHPRQDEILARYRFHAGYLTHVPALSLTRLQSQLRAGEMFSAGASVLADAFRTEQGRPVDRYLLNDGCVPLESALFMTPGPALAKRNGETAVPNWEGYRTRLPGRVTLTEGLDHGGLVTHPPLVKRVLNEAQNAEFEAFAVGRDGFVEVLQPAGQAAPTPLVRWPCGSPPSGPLCAAADGLLSVQPQAGRLWQSTPQGTRLVVGAGVAGPTSPSPDGRAVVTAEGLLLHLDRPGVARLGAPLGNRATVRWSADSQVVAISAPPRVMWADAETLDAADLALPALTPPAVRRVLGWLPVQRTYHCLVWEGDAKRLEAVIAPDESAAAVRATGGAQGLVRLCDTNAFTILTWPVPAGEPAAARLLFLDPADRTPTDLGSLAAGPCWSADSKWLTWSDYRGRLQQRLADGSLRSAEVNGTPRAVVAAADGLRALVALPAGGTALLRQRPGHAEWQTVAKLDLDVPAGAQPRVSPLGRWVLAPVGGHHLAVVGLDGGSCLIDGDDGVWLRAPVARLWADNATVQP